MGRITQCVQTEINSGNAEVAARPGTVQVLFVVDDVSGGLALKADAPVLGQAAFGFFARNRRRRAGGHAHRLLLIPKVKVLMSKSRGGNAATLAHYPGPKQQ
jgi:hypothetical protein